MEMLTQEEIDEAAALERALSDQVTPEGTSWYEQDLKPVLLGEDPVKAPAYLPRDDGAFLIYPGRAHSFVGPSETFKSWLALVAAKSVLEAGLSVLVIDFESSRSTFVERARALGITDGAIGRALRYIRPEEPLDRVASVTSGHFAG